MYRFYHFMLVGVSISLTILLIGIYVDRKKYSFNGYYEKTRLQDSEHGFVYIALSLVYILLFIYFTIRFIISFREVKNLLIPNRLNCWYNLFQMNEIDNIIGLFYSEDNTYEAAVIILYLRDLIKFIASFFLLFFAIYLIYFKNLICVKIKNTKI
ncbi:MAG: hypothetical protein AB2375_07995 [Tissierellaceae bacterium]